MFSPFFESLFSYFIGTSITSSSDFTSARNLYSSFPQYPTASLRSKLVSSTFSFPLMRKVKIPWPGAWTW